MKHPTGIFQGLGGSGELIITREGQEKIARFLTDIFTAPLTQEISHPVTTDRPCFVCREQARFATWLLGDVRCISSIHGEVHLSGETLAFGLLCAAHHKEHFR